MAMDMRSLYESILSKTNTGSATIFDKALAEYDGRQLTVDVSFDFFAEYIKYEDFKKICQETLSKVRSERQIKSKHGYGFGVERILNIILKDGVLVFRFFKDRGFIRWQPLFVSKPLTTYWSCPEAFQKGINPFECFKSKSIDNQLSTWFRFFKNNINEIKNSYTEVKSKS